MANSTSVKCADCGFTLDGRGPTGTAGKREPCPNCGSLRQIINLVIEETIQVHDYIGIGTKKPQSKHKKNRFDYESEQGKKTGRDGKLVFKKVVKDREHPDSPGSYQEFVKDAKTGEVIVDRYEKLSEHTEKRKAQALKREAGLMFKITSADQIGIVVKNADKVMESWSKMFGIGPWRSQEMAGTDAKGRPWKARLCFANLGPTQIELIEVVEGRLFHSRHLETHGEGIHHLGFYADDVDKEAAKLVAEGAKVLFANPGQFVYLDTGGPGGVIFELIKRRPA